MENKKLSYWEKFVSYTTGTSNWLLHIILGLGIANVLLSYQRHAVLQIIIALFGTFIIAGFLEFGQKIMAKLAKEILAKFKINKNIESIPSMRDAILTGIYGGLLSSLFHFIFYGMVFNSSKTRIDFLNEPFYIGIALIVISTFIWIILQIKKIKQ